MSCLVFISPWHGVASAVEVESWSEEKQGVYVLDTRNFDSSLRDGKVWLVEFYAPWCGHCTRFAPTYEHLAKKLHHKQKVSSNERKVNVAKVDGDKERALSSRFGVRGYPTFFLVDGWTVRQYDGQRTIDNLVDFVLTEYEEVDPVPFLFGPFGPMGQTRSVLMRTGTYAMGMYEGLTEKRGMKPLMAMAVLCAGGTFVGLVSIMLLGILFLPKVKSD